MGTEMAKSLVTVVILAAGVTHHVAEWKVLVVVYHSFFGNGDISTDVGNVIDSHHRVLTIFLRRRLQLELVV